MHITETTPYLKNAERYIGMIAGVRNVRINYDLVGGSTVTVNDTHTHFFHTKVVSRTHTRPDLSFEYNGKPQHMIVELPFKLVESSGLFWQSTTYKVDQDKMLADMISAVKDFVNSQEQSDDTNDADR